MEKTTEELIKELHPEEMEIVAGWFDFWDHLDAEFTGDPD